jgi:transcriptional regulator with XRE-family HTH domain
MQSTVTTGFCRNPEPIRRREPAPAHRFIDLRIDISISIYQYLYPYFDTTGGVMNARSQIGAKVRALRTNRRWTQAELAQRLELSQARLSEIERGQGSFSAEQLLEIFLLFNVDPSYFAQGPSRASHEDQLWNAAARLGAAHLMESEDVLPSQRVQQVHDVLREGLAYARSPRLLTALSAVLVARADELQLHHVEEQLARLGLSHRLSWLVESTLAALHLLLEAAPGRALALLYRRAEVVLASWLHTPRPKRSAQAADVLDADIRSDKSRAVAGKKRSTISRKWGIVSELQPADFARAIGAASEAA